MRPLLISAPVGLRLRRALIELGAGRVTLLLSAAAALIALALGQALLLLAGTGPSAGSALLTLVVTLVVAPLVAWVPVRLWLDAEGARARLDVLSTRDELTGVSNRRHFLVQADREWARCRRYDMPAAVLMVDIDHFKRINDLHGHATGDQMLREIAQAIAGTLRQADLLGRFGGEEFIAFLPHADTLGALDAAERIRDTVAHLTLDLPGDPVRTTVSVGVVPLDAEHDTLGALIADADLALCTAKEAGRNCVRTPPTPHPHRRRRGAEASAREDGEAGGPWDTRAN